MQTIMDGEYETLGTDHEYLEITNDSPGYESVSMTSPSRDSHYEQLQPTSSREFSSLNGLTTAPSSTARDNTAPPDYEPGLVNMNNIAFTRLLGLQSVIIYERDKIDVAYSYVLLVSNLVNCKSVFWNTPRGRQINYQQSM